MKNKLIKTMKFTLVELLVVIAVIAILASILLPALNRAKNTAQRIVCGNNMKQIGFLNQYYTDDNESYLPIAWSGGHNWLANWLCKIYLYDDDVNKLYSAFSKDKNIIARCPIRSLNYSQYFTIAGSNDYWVMYGINYGYLCEGGNNLKPKRLAKCSKPTETIMAADSTPEDGHNQIIHRTWNNGFPASRHQLGANTLWLDGHVSHHKQSELISPANENWWKFD